jgi:tetratricopeptide (TPR) repeat protein
MGQSPRELTPYADARHFLGAELRRYRQQRQLSQDTLGRLTYCDKALISRVEGARQVPTEAMVRRWDDALEAGGSLLAILAWVHHAQADEQYREVTYPDGDEVLVPVLTAEGNVTYASIPRRRFLADAALVALGLDATTREPGPVVPVGRVADDEVEQLRGALRHLFTMDDTFGGGAVRALAVAQLRRVHRLINEGDYTADVGAHLHRIAAEIAELAGWLCFDAGRNDEARALYTESFSTAQLADDAPMCVQVLASMSLQSIYVRRPREALNMARRAQQMAAAWATPRLASVLATREARALAATTDTAGARAALEQAGKHLQRVTGGDPAWLEFHDDAELAASAGLCYADLGQHRTAVELLGHALSAQASIYSRNRALYRVRRADSMRQLGDVDEACALAGEAVDQLGEVSSARVVSALHRFGRQVADVDTAPAREFADRLAAARIAG